MGESAQMAYMATNKATSHDRRDFDVQCDAATTAGAYFNKLECFCFTEQALESRRIR
jgi:cytochrome c oxidase assembly protein subunit 11